MRVIVSPDWFPDDDFGNPEVHEASSEKDAAILFVSRHRDECDDPNQCRVKTRAAAGGPVTVWVVYMERCHPREMARVNRVEPLTTPEVAVA